MRIDFYVGLGYMIPNLVAQFVHTPKVKYPAIGDSGTYWGSCTRLTEAQALDNAESYAMLSLGTWGTKEILCSKDMLTNSSDVSDEHTGSNHQARRYN